MEKMKIELGEKEYLLALDLLKAIKDLGFGTDGVKKDRVPGTGEMLCILLKDISLSLKDIAGFSEEISDYLFNVSNNNTS